MNVRICVVTGTAGQSRTGTQTFRFQGVEAEIVSIDP